MKQACREGARLPYGQVLAYMEIDPLPWSIHVSGTSDIPTSWITDSDHGSSVTVPSLITDTGSVFSCYSHGFEQGFDTACSTAESGSHGDPNSTGSSIINHDLISDRSVIVEMHVCSQCKKSFPYERELRYHQRIHNHIYSCIFEGCNSSFTWAKDLRRHMLTHKTWTERIHFACDFCDKFFTRTDNLARHIRLLHDQYCLPAQYDAATSSALQYSQKYRCAASDQPHSRPDAGQGPTGAGHSIGHTDINYTQPTGSSYAKEPHSLPDGDKSDKAGPSSQSQRPKRSKSKKSPRRRLRCQKCAFDGLIDPSELLDSCVWPGFEYLAHLRANHLKPRHQIDCSEGCCPEMREDRRHPDPRVPRWRRMCEKHLHLDGSKCEHDPYVDEVTHGFLETTPSPGISPLLTLPPAAMPPTAMPPMAMPPMAMLPTAMPPMTMLPTAMPLQAIMAPTATAPMAMFSMPIQDAMGVPAAMLNPTAMPSPYQLLLENNMLRRELRDVTQNPQIGMSVRRLTGQPQLSVPPPLDLAFPRANPMFKGYQARRDGDDQPHRTEMEAMRSEIRELRDRLDSLSSNRHSEGVDPAQVVSNSVTDDKPNSPFPPTPSNGNDNSQSTSRALATQEEPEFDDLNSFFRYDPTADEDNQTTGTVASRGASGLQPNPGLTEAETITTSSGRAHAQRETTSISMDPLNDVSLPFRWQGKSDAIRGSSPLFEGYPQGTSPE